MQLSSELVQLVVMMSWSLLPFRHACAKWPLFGGCLQVRAHSGRVESFKKIAATDDDDIMQHMHQAKECRQSMQAARKWHSCAVLQLTGSQKRAKNFYVSAPLNSIVNSAAVPSVHICCFRTTEVAMRVRPGAKSNKTLQKCQLLPPHTLLVSWSNEWNDLISAGKMKGNEKKKKTSFPRFWHCVKLSWRCKSLQ